MKNSHNLRDLQQKKKEAGPDIEQPVCMVCQRECEGYYARYGNTGTCSGDCMRVQDTRPKYGEHTEEAFLKQFNLE